MNGNLLIILVVTAFVILWYIATYNNFIRLKNSLEEAFSTMDVYLKKRWDLIPNLIETVKGYAQHEQGAFEEITTLRNKNYTNMTMDEKIALNKDISLGLSRLIAVAENYPDLKASQNFLNLSEQLGQIENDIASSRKYYNAITKEYNTAVLSIPSNIVASISHFEKAKMFEIDETQRENVQVKF